MAGEQDLFFDWNRAHAVPDRLAEAVVLDETLRDGIQSPSAVDPRIEEKIEILHLLDELGVAQLDVGLPGAGPHQRAAVKRLVEEIRDARLRIRANVACRTVITDIAPRSRARDQAPRSPPPTEPGAPRRPVRARPSGHRGPAACARGRKRPRRPASGRSGR